MILASDLFDQAPVDLAVGTVEERVIVGLFLAAAIAGTILVLKGRRGTDRTFVLLTLLGSAVCILFEPALAHAGGFWYADKNQHFHLPRMWGISVGLHMLFAYYVFLGVTALLVVNYVRRGATSRQLWRLYGAIFVLGVILELPVLWFTNVYTYYGQNQPYFDAKLWPLPLWYPVINASLPLAMATVVMLAGLTGQRRDIYLIPVLMPMGLYATYSAEAWPVLAVLNSTDSKPAAWIAGAVTMAFALLATKFFATSLPRLARNFSLADDGEVAAVSVTAASS